MANAVITPDEATQINLGNGRLIDVVITGPTYVTGGFTGLRKASGFTQIDNIFYQANNDAGAVNSLRYVKGTDLLMVFDEAGVEVANGVDLTERQWQVTCKGQ